MFFNIYILLIIMLSFLNIEIIKKYLILINLNNFNIDIFNNYDEFAF